MDSSFTTVQLHYIILKSATESYCLFGCYIFRKCHYLCCSHHWFLSVFSQPDDENWRWRHSSWLLEESRHWWSHEDVGWSGNMVSALIILGFLDTKVVLKSAYQLPDNTIWLRANEGSCTVEIPSVLAASCKWGPIHLKPAHHETKYLSFYICKLNVYWLEALVINLIHVHNIPFDYWRLHFGYLSAAVMKPHLLSSSGQVKRHRGCQREDVHWRENQLHWGAHCCQISAVTWFTSAFTSWNVCWWGETATDTAFIPCGTMTLAHKLVKTRTLNTVKATAG